MQKTLQGFIALLSLSTLTVYADNKTDVVWNYTGTTGPSYWGQLDKQFATCATGKTQSPINIVQPYRPAPFSLELKYQIAPMIIVNDGETALMINRDKTIVRDHAVQLNFTDIMHETILFNGKAFHLREFHFHTPAETAFNGLIQPMEIHFVHQSEDNQVAVLAVFVKTGAANPALQDIIAHIPADKGVAHEIDNGTVNPMKLMPNMKNYYYYAGSLTTPPCTEGLHWLVIPDSITASAEQIDAFKKAVGGNNARPLQPANQRTIYHAEG